MAGLHLWLAGVALLIHSPASHPPVVREARHRLAGRPTLSGRPDQEASPVADAREALPADELKPLLRGRLHQAAFFAAIPAAVVLVAVAPTTVARVAGTVYAASLVGLYGSSAAYHRLRWSRRALQRMKRLDHSMIFVLIAGTYTPFSLLVLHGAWSVAILATVWAGAAVGVALKLLRIDGMRLATGALYGTLGWLAILTAPQAVRGMSPTALGLLIAGGLMYTVGAVVLARRRPDPSPRVFGYHEIWHSFVVAAGACQYAAILLVTLGAR